MPVTPQAEIAARVHELQAALQRLELDGVLLHGPTNLFYYSASAQQAHLWVPSAGEPLLLVRRVLERARAEAVCERVEGMASLRELGSHLGGVHRIGMELDIMPVSLFERYRKALGTLEVTDIGPITRQLRAVKSAFEIDLVREAAVAADATFAAVCDAFSAGISELELSAMAEAEERRNGHQGMLRWRAPSGFECPDFHVLSGASALDFSFADTPFGGQGLTPAAPYGASRRLIERDQPVCVDFAIACDGYIHDMTRTLCAGSLPEHLLQAYRVCSSIQDEIRTHARSGVSGELLWRRCLALAADAGLEQHFMGWGAQRVHFVGHGVGLELDELPVIAPRQTMPLQVGHVIAVEPKFFFPGIGAVGLENTYAIHEESVETLTVTSEEIFFVD